MTRFAIALGCSLVLNLVFIGVWIARAPAGGVGDKFERKRDAAEAPAIAVGTPGAPVDSGSSHVSGATAVANEPSLADLAAFFGGEPKEVLARVQAAGFPTRYMLGLADAYLNLQFAERIKGMRNYTRPIPFWDPDINAPDPEYSAIVSEMADAREELMGDASSRVYGFLFHDDPAWIRRQGFDALPLEKVRAIWKINKEVLPGATPLPEQLSAAGLAGLSAEALASRDRRRLAYEAYLTPEELRAFDLRSSESAKAVRDTMGARTSSEQQFIAMYALREAFDRKWKGVRLTFEASQQKQEELRRLNAELAVIADEGRQ